MLARSSIVLLFPLKLKAGKWVNDVMHNERSLLFIDTLNKQSRDNRISISAFL
jgi:hypothetical protein